MSKDPSISISDADMSKIHRPADADAFVRAQAPLAPGFIAGIEVFHHLHCLNLIRQFTWLDHYDSIPQGLSATDHVMNRMHVDHCIETIRLALQCNADITPYLVRRQDDRTLGAKSDFNAWHRCKSWNGIGQWMEQNSAFQATPKSGHGRIDHGH